MYSDYAHAGYGAGRLNKNTIERRGQGPARVLARKWEAEAVNEAEERR